MKIILSIKPQYCEEIFAGEKRFEYRRKIFKQSVDSVLVYATSPMCSSSASCNKIAVLPTPGGPISSAGR